VTSSESVVSGNRHHVGMSKQPPLRRIKDPVVAAPPGAVRIRTRIRVNDADARALARIGVFLGSIYRAELARRVRMGERDREQRAAWRADRKQAITAMSSSRWAGAITRAVEDQYQFGMRVLAAHAADLRSAVDVLKARCALSPGELAEASTGAVRARRCRGYRTASERFAKKRRLAVLQDRLTAAERALASGRPSVAVGGKRLWRNRNNLDHAGVTERQWRNNWDATRMFLTADGESGKTGGNETIRVDDAGVLRVKTPAPLVQELGSHVVIGEPVAFAYRGDEWMARILARRAVRYDIIFDPDRDRWYLDASWKTSPEPVPGLENLRSGRVLGVDLNADHLAACVLDGSGNPIGEPVAIALHTAGLKASRRDGRVRAAISALLDLAQRNSCAAIVVENLDFADARAIGRETLGRGARGKRFRRTVAGIPTAKFRNRLTAMAVRRRIAVIGVDPAYTSQWGNQHWKIPLQQQASDPSTVTRHHGAAIGRRPTGPRTGQRTVAGTPPARPVRNPSTTRRRGSSGPPNAHSEAYRFTGKHPPPAAKTVRAAT
jgi:hypothetical protein